MTPIINRHSSPQIVCNVIVKIHGYPHPLIMMVSIFPFLAANTKDEWISCVDCHFNSNDYTLFNCLDCHEHNNQSQVDNDHSEVNGYLYESNACLSCHPDGND